MSSHFPSFSAVDIQGGPASAWSTYVNIDQSDETSEDVRPDVRPRNSQQFQSRPSLD